MQLLAAAPPGLEPLLAQELAELGLAPPRRYFKPGQGDGAVAFEGSLEALYRANLELRVAERVLLRLGRFEAGSFAALERLAARVSWRETLPAGAALTVRVDSRRSKLYHERAVAERLAGAAGRRLAAPGEAAPILQASVDRDVVTLDLDSSGEPLHRRGYRLETAKAPLRETLAAALLRASGWDKASPLLDPFCGSGTIAIEAYQLSRNLAPGRARRFAFMDWPGFDATLWQNVRARAEEAARRDGPVVAASDRDAGAIEAASANAARAGAEAIAFSRAAVSAVVPPAGTGWLVANPPYGARLSAGKDVRDVYAQLGKLLRGPCAGWKAALICPALELARATGLRVEPGYSTKNGGLDVRLFSLS